MLRGCAARRSPRLFNCAGSAGRSAARSRGEDGGGTRRDTGTLLSPGNPASLPRTSLPQRTDWTGRGGRRRLSEDAALWHCDLSHPQKAGSRQGGLRADGRAEAVQGAVSPSSCLLSSSWLDKFAAALHFLEKECVYIYISIDTNYTNTCVYI